MIQLSAYARKSDIRNIRTLCREFPYKDTGIPRGEQIMNYEES